MSINTAAINALLPDNTNREISPKDVRDCFAQVKADTDSDFQKRTRVVNNAQSLRDLTTYPDAVETLGALVAGDGGGGLWRWDSVSTATDNLGTVLLPTGRTSAGRWVRSYVGAVLPEWFGAVADGATDCRVAIQAAITAAGARGAVLLRDGVTYACDPPLTIDSPVVLMGGGPLSTIIKAIGAGNLIEISDTSRAIGGSSTPQEWVAEQQNGVSLINLTLEGNYRSQLTDALVFSGENDDFFADNIGIYNFKGAAIRIGDRSDTTQNLNLRESEFRAVEMKNCGYDSGVSATSKATIDVYKGAGNPKDNINNLHFTDCGVVYPRYIGARFHNEFTTNQFRKFFFTRCFFHGTKSLAGNDSNGDAWSNTNDLIHYYAASGAEIRDQFFRDCKLFEHQDGAAGVYVGDNSGIHWTGGEAQGYADTDTTRVGFRFENANQSAVTHICTQAGNGVKGLIDIVSMNGNAVVQIGGYSWLDDGTGVATITTTSDQGDVEDISLQTATYSYGGDSAASNTLGTRSIYRVADRSHWKRAWYIPSASLTADDTNFARLTFTIYNKSGAVRETKNTNTQTAGSGGTGDWTARVPVELTSATTKVLAPGDSIEIAISKAGAGVVVPRGAFVIELSTTVRYIQ